MAIFFLWLVLSIVIGVVAGSKGRNGFGWFILAVCVTPLIALIALLLVGSKIQAVEQNAVEAGTARRCPFCAEIVKTEAIICRHCKSNIDPAKAPAA